MTRLLLADGRIVDVEEDQVAVLNELLEARRHIEDANRAYDLAGVQLGALAGLGESAELRQMAFAAADVLAAGRARARSVEALIEAIADPTSSRDPRPEEET
jgi:hypothetical protein